MTATLSTSRRPVGDLLREWRQRRRLSQLELSCQAEVSSRHLSFVESGKARPSRQMVLHLAEHLDVPLRERNTLLVAAGFAPVYSTTDFGAPAMAPVRQAIDLLLAAHEPNPTVVVDRRWDLVAANATLGLLLADLEPALAAGRVNVLRAALHPDGLAPRVLDFGGFSAHLLGRLRRQVALSGDPELSELYDELAGYPGVQADPGTHPVEPALFVPVRLTSEAGVLSFFTTISTFGHPLDVTLAELAIESFLPADAHTAAVLHAAG